MHAYREFRQFTTVSSSLSLSLSLHNRAIIELQKDVGSSVKSGVTSSLN